VKSSRKSCLLQKKYAMRVLRNRDYPALISPFTKYRLANPSGDHLEPCDTGSPAGNTIAASSCSTEGIPAMGFVFEERLHLKVSATGRE